MALLFFLWGVSRFRCVNEYNLLMEHALLSFHFIVQHPIFKLESCGFLCFVRLCTLSENNFVIHGLLDVYLVHLKWTGISRTCTVNWVHHVYAILFTSICVLYIWLLHRVFNAIVLFVEISFDHFLHSLANTACFMSCECAHARMKMVHCL